MNIRLMAVLCGTLAICDAVTAADPTPQSMELLKSILFSGGMKPRGVGKSPDAPSAPSELAQSAATESSPSVVPLALNGSADSVYKSHLDNDFRFQKLYLGKAIAVSGKVWKVTPASDGSAVWIYLLAGIERSAADSQAPDTIRCNVTGSLSKDRAAEINRGQTIMVAGYYERPDREGHGLTLEQCGISLKASELPSPDGAPLGKSEAPRALNIKADITQNSDVTTARIGAASILPPAVQGELEETAQKNEAYAVFVPAEADLRGVGGVVFETIDRPRPSIVSGSYYFRFEPIESGEVFNLKVCDGELRGKTFSAIECGMFDSRTRISKAGGGSRISFSDVSYNAEYQPNKLDLVRIFGGKSLIASMNPSHMLKYLNSHTIQKTGEIYVPYPPESVKANFDRKFKRDAELNRIRMLDKFRAKYVFYSDDKKKISGGLDFYPNKNGTMIEFHLVGYMSSLDETIVDWRSPFAKAVQDVERIGGL